MRSNNIGDKSRLNRSHKITGRDITTHSTPGETFAFLLPLERSDITAGTYSHGLKQLINAPSKLVIFIIPLRDKTEKILTTGSKILDIEKIKTPAGNLEIDRQLTIRLAEKFELEQTQNENHLFASMRLIYKELAASAPEKKILTIMLGSTELEKASILGEFLATNITESQPVIVALGSLDSQGLTELEYCDADLFLNYSQGFLENNPKTDNCFAPILSALVYSNLKGGYNITPISPIPNLFGIDTISSNLTAAKLWKYQPPELKTNQKTNLMRLGYEAIREYLTTQKIPKITIDDPALEQESGVFITIRQNSNLRGCIGTLTADSPLYLAVQNMAIAAATSDPRFYPLNLEDLPKTSIKVAILSPLQRMGIDQIEIGKHGLLIIHQGRRGVLLPEVPVDRGWDKAEFLTHLCIKAGLDPQSIKNNPKLYGFTTIEFESSYKDIFKE